MLLESLNIPLTSHYISVAFSGLTSVDSAGVWVLYRTTRSAYSIPRWICRQRMLGRRRYGGQWLGRRFVTSIQKMTTHFKYPFVIMQRINRYQYNQFIWIQCSLRLSGFFFFLSFFLFFVYLGQHVDKNVLRNWKKMWKKESKTKMLFSKISDLLFLMAQVKLYITVYLFYYYYYCYCCCCCCCCCCCYYYYQKLLNAALHVWSLNEIISQTMGSHIKFC